MTLTYQSGGVLSEAMEKAPLSERIERYFFVFILLYAAGALIQLLVLGPVPLRGRTMAEPVVLRAIWGGAYVVFAGFALARIKLYLYVLREQPMLCALMMFMVLSAAWSAEPATSLQHAVVAVIGIAIGVFLGMRYGADGVVRLLAMALAVAMVASLVIMLALPAWGTDRGLHAGAWLGAFSHKNALGSMSLLAILSFTYVAGETGSSTRRLWYGLMVVALVLLIGSGSATSMIGLLVMGAAAYGLRVFRRSQADITLAMAGLVAFVFGAVPAFALVLETILAAMGRDLTFTGRTDLWSMGLDSLLHRPLLGFGFDGFWDNHSSYGGAQIRAYVGWDTPHVHNSWLEVALGIGCLGLALFATVFFGLFRRAIGLLRQRGARIDYFVALFMLYLCLFSLDEQVFLVRNDVLTLLLTAFATGTLIDTRVLAGEKAGMAA